MCDQQSLRSACAYAQSDQSLCYSLGYSLIVKLLTEHHLAILSLKGGCRGLSESTNVKMPHCWKSHALALFILNEFTPPIISVWASLYCLIIHHRIIGGDKTFIAHHMKTYTQKGTLPSEYIVSGNRQTTIETTLGIVTFFHFVKPCAVLCGQISNPW